MSIPSNPSSSLPTLTQEEVEFRNIFVPMMAYVKEGFATPETPEEWDARRRYIELGEAFGEWLDAAFEEDHLEDPAGDDCHPNTWMWQACGDNQKGKAHALRIEFECDGGHFDGYVRLEMLGFDVGEKLEKEYGEEGKVVWKDIMEGIECMISEGDIADDIAHYYREYEPDFD